MYPNNHEFMYSLAKQRAKEIRAEVEASRGDPLRPHILRRRLTTVVAISLIGLTLVAAMLVFGLWVL